MNEHRGSDWPTHAKGFGIPPERMKDEHFFAPHAVECYTLRRRRAWARAILLIGVAASSFWLGVFLRPWGC